MAAAGLGFKGEPSDDFTIAGTESQKSVELLQQKLPAFSGAQTQITFAVGGDTKVTDAKPAGGIRQAIDDLRTVP